MRDRDRDERTHPEVVVVVGVGGMGAAIARRQGSGRRLLIADVAAMQLDPLADSLADEGYDVTTQLVDVTDGASIQSLAATASSLGEVRQVVHTAGVSPADSTVEAIIAVDLVGVALALEAFGDVIAPGGAGVVVASMAAHICPLSDEVLGELASCSTGQLASHPSIAALDDPAMAYGVCKRANQVRVEAESITWGRVGARLNSVSPGLVSTAMGRRELAGPAGAFVRAIVDGSPSGRVGTAADVADAVAYLLGPQSSFVTGTDLLVDGGAVAAQRHIGYDTLFASIG